MGVLLFLCLRIYSSFQIELEVPTEITTRCQLYRQYFSDRLLLDSQQISNQGNYFRIT